MSGEPVDGNAQPNPQPVESEPAAAPVVVEQHSPYPLVVKDLQLLSGPNPILRHVSFAVEKQKLIALLGESGAGKTTLLRLLARKLNEKVLDIEGTGVLPKEIWYIAQEDVLYEYDTPRRVVAFLHELLYGEGSTVANEEAERLLRKVRFPMQLIDQTVGTSDDGLSVGSRRLLNVALALCAKAEVVLLDEPTTGLDSSTAANLVSVLHELCHEENITAICTIHQPSDQTLSYFDDLLVMVDGEAFVGQQHEEATDPMRTRAEHLLAQATRGLLKKSDVPQGSWSGLSDDMYSTRLDAQLSKLSNTDPVPFGRQLWLLFKRFAFRNIYNPFALRFRIVTAIFFGLLIGVAFWKLPYDNPRYLRDHLGFYIASLANSFVPMAMTAGVFPGEKASLIHEMGQSKRFDVLPYFLARSLWDLLPQLLSTVSNLISFGMMGMESGWAETWFSFCMQGFLSDSFGLMLSVRFAPEISISALLPTVGFVSVLLGTGMASPPKKDAGWIFHVLKWGSFFKYVYAAAVGEQLPKMSGTCQLGQPGCAYESWEVAMSELELQRTGFVSKLGFQWMMMALIYLAFRIIILIQFRGLVSAAKFTYKAATDWKKKQAAQATAATATPPPQQHPPGHEPADAEEMSEKEPEEQVESCGLFEPPKEVIEPINTDTRPMHISDGDNMLHCEGGLELHWDIELYEKGKHGHLLLNCPSGVAKGGEVLAVLGPSGSGKSLFLKALSWQLPVYDVDWNRSKMEINAVFMCDMPKERPSVRFVYQNDTFVPGDIVRDSIIRQIALSMKVPEEEFDKLCKCILKTMRLSHVADKKASEISGGQLRRLSIACQLAHQPRILILDEPTSGLDSELALDAMKALKNFARASGAVVICTLNQPGKKMLPEVDQFIFLAGGRALSHGPLASVTKHMNIGEVKQDAVTDAIIEKIRLCELGRESLPPYQGNLTPDQIAARRKSQGTSSMLLRGSNRYAPPEGLGPLLKRISILVKRNALSRLSNPVRYFAELFIKFILFGAFLSLLFAQTADPRFINRMAFLLINTGAMQVISAMTPVVLFSLESSVFVRETRADDYSPMTYFFARWIFELPGEVIFHVIGTIVYFYIFGLEGSIGISIATNLMMYQAGVGLGSMFAVIPQSMSVNGSMAMLAVILFVITADVIITPMQADRIKIIYPFEVINPVRFCSLIQLKEEASQDPILGPLLLQQLGINRNIDDTWVLWMSLPVVMVVFRIGAILCGYFRAWTARARGR